MDSSEENTQRQRYTLGHGVFTGSIDLDNGKRIWLEYMAHIVYDVSTLDYLQNALEYICSKFCEECYYNHIEIQYVSEFSAGGLIRVGETSLSIVS
ncbi:hypothetical protein GGR51DRAFT_506999 [Nemania sp. FL0031]|nr:hypothetical protein GGR51DRAFT_506999 [Nemania sp. FL0031]